MDEKEKRRKAKKKKRARMATAAFWVLALAVVLVSVYIIISVLNGPTFTGRSDRLTENPYGPGISPPGTAS